MGYEVAQGYEVERIAMRTGLKVSELADYQLSEALEYVANNEADLAPDQIAKLLLEAAKRLKVGYVPVDGDRHLIVKKHGRYEWPESAI